MHAFQFMITLIYVLPYPVLYCKYIAHIYIEMSIIQREGTSQERNLYSSALIIVDRMAWRTLVDLATQPHLFFQCTDGISS